MDGRASDGIFSDGYRIVRKNGRVKAGGWWFKDDKLITYVGQSVYLDNMDYWYTEINVSTNNTHTLICTAKREE